MKTLLWSLGIARRYGYGFDFALQRGPGATVRMIPKFLSKSCDMRRSPLLLTAYRCLPPHIAFHHLKTSHIPPSICARLSLVSDTMGCSLELLMMLMRPQASLRIHSILACKTNPSPAPISHCEVYECSVTSRVSVAERYHRRSTAACKDRSIDSSSKDNSSHASKLPIPSTTSGTRISFSCICNV